MGGRAELTELYDGVGGAEIAVGERQVAEDVVVLELLRDVGAVVPVLDLHHAVRHADHAPAVVEGQTKAAAVVAAMVILGLARWACSEQRERVTIYIQLS